MTSTVTRKNTIRLPMKISQRSMQTSTRRTKRKRAICISSEDQEGYGIEDSLVEDEDDSLETIAPITAFACQRSIAVALTGSLPLLVCNDVEGDMRCLRDIASFTVFLRLSCLN